MNANMNGKGKAMKKGTAVISLTDRKSGEVLRTVKRSDGSVMGFDVLTASGVEFWHGTKTIER